MAILFHTPFSRFLRQAAQEYSEAQAGGRTVRPYHLVLDEMNLARVEYYFAKFLSAMEMRARKEIAGIELAPGDEVLLTPNLCFIGTVNIDETTHGFADKVHDRAQLIELSLSREIVAAHLADTAYRAVLLAIWDTLYPTVPVGFRILDEMTIYISEAEKIGVSWQDALDEQLLQKVLPKCRGTDPQLRDALQELARLIIETCPLSHQKTLAMLEGMQQHGFASYFS